MKYNVVGGGDSALYGVEGPTFYLRNGLNNFQALLPLALALPLLAAVGGGASLCRPASGPPKGSSGGNKKTLAGAAATGGGLGRLMVCVAPVYVWLALITALPHKEERFLYVVYPLVSAACLASRVSRC